MRISFNKGFVLSGLIIGLAVVVGYTILAGSEAAAQKISYPVAELGNCGSEGECRTFCDDPDNIKACVDFAENNGLMSPQEVAKARKFIKAGAKGPGGCRGEAECAAYCEDTAHIDECLSFAERTGIIDESELAEARKVQKVLKEGGSLPGGCRSKAECENYCNDFDHAEECFDFAKRSGFISEDELAEAEQAVAAIKSGARPPGGCRNKAQCEDYCSDPENIEECFAFAERAGFIPPEEAEQARKVIPLMKAGKTPGGCKSKTECEAFCEDGANIEVCANFAIEAGFMKPEEAEMFKKTGGKGPGGCRGRECEDFCNDPANQEACFSFAQEHNLIPEEELEQMRQGMEQFRDGLESAPPEVAECLKSSLGSETFDKLQSGRAVPGPQMGEVVRTCFENSMRAQFEEGEGFGPGGFEGGHEGEFGPPPGVSPEEFEKFKQQGGFPGGEGGGMPSEEDIEKFQQGGFEGFNPEDFKNGPPSQEQIQNMIQERTQGVIQQRMQEEFQKRGGSFPGQEGGEGMMFGPNSGPSGGGDQSGGFGPGPSDFQQGGFQPSGGGFSPLPSGGSQPPPPASSALDVILAPFLNMVR